MNKEEGNGLLQEALAARHYRKAKMTTITFRLLEAEKESLETIAKERDTTLSEVVRAAILNNIASALEMSRTDG